MFGTQTEFKNRKDAGERLARELEHYRDSNPVILALPRGGVPVAFEIAKVFKAPLDLLMVRKLGAPNHPEYGIGAVVDGSDPQIVLNEDAMQVVNPPPGYVEAEKQRQLEEIERRRSEYLAGRKPVELAGRTVIVVDDGIATGGTVRVALNALRRAKAATIVLAVPVAPRDVLDRLHEDADEVVCLNAPAGFRAVGLHYEDFGQTSDAEVIQLMEATRAWLPPEQ